MRNIKCVRPPDRASEAAAVSVAVRPEKSLNIQRMATRLVSMAISVSARIGKKAAAKAIPATRVKAGKAASQRRKNQTPDIALFFDRMVRHDSVFTPDTVISVSPAKPSTVTSNSVDAYCASHLMRGSRLGSCAHTIKTLRL